jgi:hypothetical protein
MISIFFPICLHSLLHLFLYYTSPLPHSLISTAIATTVVQPFDIIKVNIQLNPDKPKMTIVQDILYARHTKSTLSGSAIVEHKANLFRFYKGIDVALLRQSVYGTIRLGMFQDLKDNYKIHPMLAATVAASTATLVNNPIDYWLG